MSGLINEILKQLSGVGLSIKPQIISNELVIRISEEEIRKAVLKNVPENIRSAINIEIHEKQIVIKVRLL